MKTRKLKSVKACTWHEDEWDCTWRTDCDNEFQFNADGPEENGFKFCPYCGGALRITPIQPKRRAEK